MRLRRALGGLLVFAAALIAALPAASAPRRERWDTRVLALVPRPGFPARAYVAPARLIYEGTYDNPSGDSVPSRVLQYTPRGALLHSWTIRGQDLSEPHGVQVATSASRGRLVLLDKSPPRVLLLDPVSGRQRTYATFADLPVCDSASGGSGCSPNSSDEPATPNYTAWGPGGALYVTDYLQAVIWRVPPGGGRAKVWLSNPELDGGMFGTTGIVLTPDRRKLLVAQQSSAGGGDGNPSTGKLYSVPLRGSGADRSLTELWESRPVDGPDGFALARSGRVYITLTAANQIAVLDRAGHERERFPAGPLSGENGSTVPFDNPSSAMFLGRRLIVANQSFISGDATHQAILDVYAGERGAPEFIPRRAGLPPR